MSLLPVLFSDWWEDLDRPHRLLDQHFGLTLSPEDLVGSSSPLSSGVMVLRPSGHLGRRFSPYDRYRSGKRSNGSSVVKADRDQFRVTLDVQQFAPEEVSVKVVDKCVVVKAKHEEKKDDHGWISRQFVRKYPIPSQCDIEQVSSSLSSDGVLTVSAPRKETAKEKAERIIEIQHTGQPALKGDDSPVESEEEKKEKSSGKNQPREQNGEKKTVKAA